MTLLETLVLVGLGPICLCILFSGRNAERPLDPSRVGQRGNPSRETAAGPAQASNGAWAEFSSEGQP